MIVYSDKWSLSNYGADNNFYAKIVSQKNVFKGFFFYDLIKIGYDEAVGKYIKQSHHK